MQQREHNRPVEATTYSSSCLAPRPRTCCEMPRLSPTFRCATPTPCHSHARARHHTLLLTLLLATIVIVIFNININIVSCIVPPLSCSDPRTAYAGLRRKDSQHWDGRLRLPGQLSSISRNHIVGDSKYMYPSIIERRAQAYSSLRLGLL